MSQYRKNEKALASLTSISLGISIFIIFAVMLITPEFRTLYAETGTGKDVFKVIVSVFDISNETGDIVTTVNVNGNSKVKSFDSDYLNIWPVSDNSSTRLIEYIATFPGIEVKPGDKYKACVLVVETANTICKEGANSPGKRPEVVDISLDSDSSTAAVMVVTENTGTKKADAKKLDTEDADAKKLDTEDADAKKLDTEDADAKKLDTEDADAKKLDTEDADAKKLDTEDADAKKLDTEDADAKKLDTEDADAKKLDTEDADAKKLDTEKLNADGLGSEPLVTDEVNIF